MGLCLTGASFSMWADVKRQMNDDPTTTSDNGDWVIIQDPDSGEITRIWRSFDNEATSGIDESDIGESFPCFARGVVSQGIRTQSVTQDWTQVYRATDIIQLEYPANVTLRRSDRVTNVRDSKGNIVWREEEQVDAPATIFVVNGVVPVMGPFNNHVKNFALLERAENQNDSNND